MDAVQPILGNELRNIRTPQQLQELSRRIQAEIRSATVNICGGVYDGNPSRQENRSQSTPSRPPPSSSQVPPRYSQVPPPPYSQVPPPSSSQVPPSRSSQVPPSRSSQVPPHSSQVPPSRSSQAPPNYNGPWQDEYRSYGPSMQWDDGAHNGAPFSSPQSHGRQGGMPNTVPPERRSDNPDWRSGRPYSSGLPNLDRLNLRTDFDRQQNREQNRSSAGSSYPNQRNTTHDRNNESYRGPRENSHSNAGSGRANQSNASRDRNNESYREPSNNESYRGPRENSHPNTGGRANQTNASHNREHSYPAGGNGRHYDQHDRYDEYVRQEEYNRDRADGYIYRNSSLNRDDEDLIDRVYNLYDTPLDYRQRSFGPPSHAPPPYRTNQWDDPNCSSIPPFETSNQATAMPLWQFRGPELKLTPFSGVSEEFYDWMPTFRAQVDSYPEQLRVSTLRENLDPDSKAFVAYIGDSDPGAYEKIWEELERRCNLGVASHHRYIGKLLVLINSPPVHDVKGLEHIYNTLNYSWAKLCGLGARYAGYAEPILPLLSNILFDKSQRVVDGLTGTAQLTVPNVLDGIWQHMTQLRRREHNQRICAPPNLNPARPQTPRQAPSRSYNQRYSGAQLMKTSAGASPQDPDMSSSTSSNFNRRSSPERSRNSSPTRYRSPASSPNRLRSGSPSTDRRKHFRCSFCEINDHSHLDCTRFSPGEQFQICKTKRLCFGYRSGGHPASLCPFTSLLCVSPDCSGSPPHAVIFCQFAKEQ